MPTVFILQSSCKAQTVMWESLWSLSGLCNYYILWGSYTQHSLSSKVMIDPVQSLYYIECHKLSVYQSLCYSVCAAWHFSLSLFSWGNRRRYENSTTSIWERYLSAILRPEMKRSCIPSWDYNTRELRMHTLWMNIMITFSSLPMFLL